MFVGQSGLKVRSHRVDGYDKELDISEKKKYQQKNLLYNTELRACLQGILLSYDWCVRAHLIVVSEISEQVVLDCLIKVAN